MTERDPVADAAAELSGMLPSARALLPQPDVDTPAMVTGGAPVSSQIPGNPAAAYAYFGAVEGAVRLENEIRTVVTGSGGEIRPRTASQAEAALAATPKLAEALDQVHQPRDARNRCLCLRCDASRRLARLARTIRLLPAIDTDVAWLPIRGADPARPPLCPYCDNATLRRADRLYVVICCYPDCADGDGNQPHAVMGVNRLTAEPQLEWDDGLVT